jgi:hypothetical protein
MANTDRTLEMPEAQARSASMAHAAMLMQMMRLANAGPDYAGQLARTVRVEILVTSERLV